MGLISNLKWINNDCLVIVYYMNHFFLKGELNLAFDNVKLKNSVGGGWVVVAVVVELDFIVKH